MKHPLLIPGLIIVLLLLLAPGSYAQVYYNAKTLTTADGLSDKRVTCFHKDRKGFMWIGTRNGLNRYDGHSFKVFLPGTGNSISNEVINDIEEDSKGRIWVATMEGLNIYDPATAAWEVMVPDPDIDGSDVPNYIIWDLQINQQDLVWIASDVFEFCSYDIKTKKFTYYDWPSFARQHPLMKAGRYRSIQQFVAKNDHEYWLGTTTGLVSLDTRTNEFRYWGGGYYGDVIDIRYDAVNGKVFISIEGGLFFEYDEHTGAYNKLVANPAPYPSTQYLLPGKNEIWMASQSGVIKISDDRKRISLESNIPQLSGSLLPGGVNAVFDDDRHLRWVATANGVSIYDLQSSSAAFLPLLTASDKEGANRMGGVYYDDISGCYFACAIDPAAVFIINANTGQVKKITTDAAGRNLSLCTGMKKDKEKNLWLLTGNHVYRYDRGTGQFVLFPMPGEDIESVFRDMLQDEAGNYWFASFNQGIDIYDTKKKSFTRLKDTSLYNFRTATGLSADLENKLVVGGTYGEGVFTYHIPTGKITWYYETANTKDYSQLILASSMAKDAKDGIWVTTNAGGVFRYNPGKSFEESFTRFDMRNGLSSNNILSMCSDGDTTLWLLSGKGISAISTSGKFLFDLDERGIFNFSSYGSDSRYPHDIFFNTIKKELLVGVGGGLLFYSLHPADSTLRFPLAITGIRINGKIISENEMNSTAGYRLPFNSNAVAYEFAGLYYGNAEGLIYEYKLEGYDKEWKEATGNYAASYQNLPSGNYTFRVRAKNSNGSIAGEVAASPFSVVPPFWRTWWFIILAVLLSGFTIWWFIHSLQTKLRVERMINTFATSLYGQNTTEDIFWDTAKNCIEQLGFSDCVIYQRNESRNVLLQAAAYGPKNPHRREIANVIEIPVGQGIVGSVAQTGKAVIIRDTSKDPRYIVDDEKRLSEIAVPVMVDGKVFAVIDSEHPQKNFYSTYHLRVLKKIAAICAERITKHLTEEKLRAKIARDLHDEMGSTLTSINIISTVAMEEKQEQEKLKQYFQKIKDHSGRMMESMSDMVWAINPVNDNFEKVILRMKEFAAEILEPARINYYFTEEGLLENTYLNLEQRKDIYMIFKEAINNVVKYSSATEVNIMLRRTGNMLRMMITDNGNGFDATKVSAGNGLKNMRSRSEEMGATIKIDSVAGTGTSIAIELLVP